MSGILDTISTMFTTVIDWAEEHPVVATMIGGAIAGAVTPDEIDILEKKDELERDRERDDRIRRAQNLSVGSISLFGDEPSKAKKFLGKPLTRRQPAGLITSAMRGGV